MKKFTLFLLCGLLHIASLDAQTQRPGFATFQNRFNVQNTKSTFKLRLDSIVSLGEGKEVFNYDNDGNLTSLIRYNWGNKGWQQYQKEEFTYGSNGSPTSSIIYWWENNAWQQGEKIEYSYHNNGSLTPLIIYGWYDNAWHQGNKFEYTYDNKGNLTTVIFYHWYDKAWRQIRKDEYTYDNSGNRTSQISYEWENNAWQQDQKVEFTYDNNGNPISRIYHWWENNAWRQFLKSELSFDLTYSTNDLIMPLFFLEQVGGNNKLMEVRNYEFELPNTWMLSSVATLYYSAVTETGETSLADKDVVTSVIHASPIQIYPNPVINELRLTNYELRIGEMIELFDMSGRRVFSQRIAVETRHATSPHGDTFTVDMTPFHPGNYILRIGNRVAKIVKQ